MFGRAVVDVVGDTEALYRTPFCRSSSRATKIKQYQCIIPLIMQTWLRCCHGDTLLAGRQGCHPLPHPTITTTPPSRVNRQRQDYNHNVCFSGPGWEPWPEDVFTLQVLSLCGHPSSARQHNIDPYLLLRLVSLAPPAQLWGKSGRVAT